MFAGKPMKKEENNRTSRLCVYKSSKHCGLWPLRWGGDGGEGLRSGAQAAP